MCTRIYEFEFEFEFRVNVSPLQDVTRDKRLSAPKHKDLFCSVLFEKHVYFGRAVGGRGG